MKTMELFKVRFDTKDFEAYERWEKALEAHLRIRRTEETPFLKPMPEPKQYERYVAVHGAFGMDIATRAGELAIEQLIGPRDTWEKYEVVVRSIEHVEPVTVEEACVYSDGELS